VAKTTYHVVQYGQHLVWRFREEDQVRVRRIFRLWIENYVGTINFPASHFSNNREHHRHEPEIFAAVAPLLG